MARRWIDAGPASQNRASLGRVNSSRVFSSPGSAILFCTCLVLMDFMRVPVFISVALCFKVSVALMYAAMTI